MARIVSISCELEGAVSFLNQLKSQASALQTEQSTDKAMLEANCQQTEWACKTAWQYLSELAKNLDNVGKQATNPTDGYLSSRIKGEQTLGRDYTKQIATVEERMTSRQKALEHQFASLESMLSKLQSQGNWLAGQLKTLPSSMG